MELCCLISSSTNQNTSTGWKYAYSEKLNVNVITEIATKRGSVSVYFWNFLRNECEGVLHFHVMPATLVKIILRQSNL